MPPTNNSGPSNNVAARMQNKNLCVTTATTTLQGNPGTRTKNLERDKVDQRILTHLAMAPD